MCQYSKEHTAELCRCFDDKHIYWLKDISKKEGKKISVHSKSDVQVISLDSVEIDKTSHERKKSMDILFAVRKRKALLTEFKFKEKAVDRNLVDEVIKKFSDSKDRVLSEIQCEKRNIGNDIRNGFQIFKEYIVLFSNDKLVNDMNRQYNAKKTHAAKNIKGYDLVPQTITKFIERFFPNFSEHNNAP
jgi:hypothetical protein